MKDVATMVKRMKKKMSVMVKGTKEDMEFKIDELKEMMIQVEEKFWFGWMRGLCMGLGSVLGRFSWVPILISSGPDIMNNLLNVTVNEN